MKLFPYSSSLASSDQPSPEDLEVLKSQGYEVIVNLSPASTKNALPDEAHRAAALGLEYFYHPVDCSNLTPEHYQGLRDILGSRTGKKTLVHCGGNIKASALVHMVRVLDQGVEESQSLETLLKIHQPEPKWFTYFRSQGLQGLDRV